jgi:hypothetical protein
MSANAPGYLVGRAVNFRAGAVTSGSSSYISATCEFLSPDRNGSGAMQACTDTD